MTHGAGESLRIEVAPERALAVTVAPGGGPVALLAHGVGSSARFVREAFGVPLADAGWRLASVDLRGHGDSDPAPLPLDHALDTVAADLTEVASVLRAEVLGGVSIGGMAAVRAVAGRRAGGPLSGIRAVVAVIPGWTGTAERGVGPHAAVADEIRTIGVEGMLARLEAEADLPAWIRDVVLRDFRRADPGSLAAALVALDGAEGPGEVELEALDVPLGLVGWPDDPGHPLDVARAWTLRAKRSTLMVTSIEAMQNDRTAFGRAAVEAIARLGVVARWSGSGR